MSEVDFANLKPDSGSPAVLPGSKVYWVGAEVRDEYENPDISMVLAGLAMHWVEHFLKLEKSG